MRKRISSRAVIVEDDSVMTIFRRKITNDGIVKEYYVIPGGGLEDNETLEENVKREIKEEFGIDIEILGYLGKEEDDTGIANFFHCKKIGGTPKLGGPEAEKNNPSNYYEIRYVELNRIHDIDLLYTNMIEKAINREYVNVGQK